MTAAAATSEGKVALGKRHLDEETSTLFSSRAMKVLGGGGLLALAFLVFPSVRQNWLHSYLVAVAFYTSIALGALWFVILQHLVKAGWSVVVRRLAEGISLNLLWLPLLYIPIVVAVGLGADLFPAAHGDPLAGHHGAAPDDGHAGGGHGDEGHADEGHAPEGAAIVPPTEHGVTEMGALRHHPLSPSKAAWLNAWGGSVDGLPFPIPGFIPRLVVYFVIWIFLALLFHGRSVKQDDTGDVGLTKSLEWHAPWAMILFALTASLLGFDILMALDPYWFSTIFGVYFFAGSALAFFAVMILGIHALQRRGLIAEVSTEHYHDLGKLMFGFVIFWAYIAFSQFMLIWYANIPEETVWFIGHAGLEWTDGWRLVSLWLVFGHFFIPFFLLMSRWPKRRPHLLVWGAVWMLALHYIDLFWVVMPTAPDIPGVPVPIDHLGLFLLFGGLFVAATVKLLEGKSLIPERDPRLVESLRFENY